jgi:hypothetical protein
LFLPGLKVDGERKAGIHLLVFFFNSKISVIGFMEDLVFQALEIEDFFFFDGPCS